MLDFLVELENAVSVINTNTQIERIMKIGRFNERKKTGIFLSAYHIPGSIMDIQLRVEHNEFELLLE